MAEMCGAKSTDMSQAYLSFLAVQNSSIGDLVTDSLTHPLLIFDIKDIQRATLET